MQEEHRSGETTPSQSRADAQTQEAILSAVPANRREFVKRLLVATGTGIAAITALSVSEVMARGKFRSFGT
jgi:hypothetical protein